MVPAQHQGPRGHSGLCVVEAPCPTESGSKSAQLHPVWRTRSASSRTKPSQDNPPAAPVPHRQLGLTCSQRQHIGHQRDLLPLIPPSPPQPQPLGAPSLAMYVFHTLRYRYISPTLAPCRFECTRSGFYLVSNHKPDYGGGNTRFSWLANSKTSHWDIFVSGSPLQREVPVKPRLNQFLHLLSKSCLPLLRSSPRLRAKPCTCFSVRPQLTNRYSPSVHLATKNGSLQPKSPFLSPSWKICIHLLGFSSENQKWAMLLAYNNHTQKCQLLQVRKCSWAFSLPFPHPWLVRQMSVKLSLRKGNIRNELHYCNLDCPRYVNT